MTSSRAILRLVRTIMALFLPALVFVACDVHEFPVDEPEKVDCKYLLHLRFDTDLPIFKEVFYENGSLSEARSRSGRSPEYDIRYIINLYPAVRTGEYSRSAEHSFVRTVPRAHGLDADFELPVPPGDYRIYVWADYVGHDEAVDLFYDTSDFSEIIIANRNDYVGDDDFRDAFCGSLDAKVDYGPEYSLSRNREIIVEGTVRMERPLAKYRFISTDLAEFIKQQFDSRRSAFSAAQAPGAEDASRALDLSEYSVRVIYSQYLPCSFNMFTNRPADSWTGVSYKSALLQISDDEAEVCFDYVFINGGESTVSVALEIYYSDGELVASTAPFNVPLKRSKLTEVRGTFLTTNSGGALGINPEFEGEYNIFVY
ncbi:MAG: hypothetical protein K2M06_01420 [Muribaculaceae bacterium]|nr:hypothetical protein [Muribaculaceae bacterium]